MDQIETLQQTVERQQTVIDGLLTRLEALEAHPTAPPASRATTAGPDQPRRGRVTRRGLLTAAVAGGAGLVAEQLATAGPAAAAAGDAVVLGQINDGGSKVTTIQATPGQNSSPFGVVNANPTGDGIGIYSVLGTRSGAFDGSPNSRAAVIGDSADSTGVAGLGENGTGVYGYSVSGLGVFGYSTRQPGVYGEGDSRAGVMGVSNQDAGVHGKSSPGPGVLGESTGGSGVYGSSETNVGVLGASAAGVGVQGEGGSGGAGVYGTNTSGPGVLAASATGSALSATSTGGYGVEARGGRAPLRLVPSTKTTGAPTSGSHQVGELFLDKVGALFLCVAAGKPGTWKKVTVS